MRKILAWVLSVLLLHHSSLVGRAQSQQTGKPAAEAARSTGINAAKEVYSPIPFSKHAGADLESIRKRIIGDLLEPQVDETRVKQLVSSIKPDGSWPGINYEDVSRTGFQHSQHLENMLELSRAYKKKDSPFNHNAEVKKTVSAALDFWIAHDFICENWWWNEMGTPNLMINTLLVLDEDLTEKQRTEGARIANRANLEASGARPGGDLIQIAAMLGKQGLFARDEATLERVVKVMAQQIKITTDRGIKPDLSFHHRVDHVISTLTYGTGYANAFSYWAVKIAGTKYKLPEASMKLLVDYYLDGVCKSLIYATYPDPAAMNRDLSRKGALEPVSPLIAQNLLLASNYRRAELEEIVRIRKGETKPALISDRFFWHSSYFTHQRPHYFASVRMHSSRNFNMEQPHNEEGLKNHHFADGSNFISITGKEFFDIFPVWNWQRIPGATIVQKPSLPPFQEIPKKGLTDFSGAASDGKYGVAAFDFVSPHDPLKARKSWFFFDEEYVCLGAAIHSTSNYPVITTLNQCLSNGEVLIRSTGKTVKPGKRSRQFQQVSWVYHNGVAYLFPKPGAVHVSDTTATGNWRSINHQAWATEDPVSAEVFSLWIDHGIQPQEATYEYIVVPAIASNAIEAYTKKKNIKVLSNTSALQAVKHVALNRVEAVFYKAGSLALTANRTLEVNEPCIVMVTLQGEQIKEMSISDPAQKLVSITVKLNPALRGTVVRGKGTAAEINNSSTINIELPQGDDAGKTAVVYFNKRLG